MNMTVQLPGGNLDIERLGFGCAYLAGGGEKANSLRNVSTAMDVGYRHFDVAPAYGMGFAEDILGQALVGNRANVTIASKVGLARPKSPLKSQIVRFLATPVRRFMPGLTKSLGQKMYQANVQYGRFDVQFVEASVHESLRRLRTDYLDILHLHEVRPEDISQELLTWLSKARDSGMCRAIGIASQKSRVDAILLSYAKFFDVAQYSWSLMDTDATSSDAFPFRITHRAIMNAHQAILSRFAEDPNLRAKLSTQAGIDLSEGDNLSLALLGSALVQNENGIVLAGSRKAERIAANWQAIADPKFQSAGRSLMNAFEHNPLQRKVADQ